MTICSIVFVLLIIGKYSPLLTFYCILYTICYAEENLSLEFNKTVEFT